MGRRDVAGIKCVCGHAQSSHRSCVGIIGGGIRSYDSCRFCSCEQFRPKKIISYQEWMDGKK